MIKLDSEKPVISVIIPAHNEAEYISDALFSLKNQDFSLSYEVIVVDNASIDNTAKIALSFGVKVVREERLGLTFAREKGAAESKGKILAYLDADTIATKGWLSRIYKDFSEYPDIVAVSGKVYFYDWDSNFWNQILAAIFDKEIIMRADRIIRKTLRKTEVLWGANFALKKEVLKRIGGFNKSIKFYGEDIDLSIRLNKVGNVLFDDKLIVYSSARKFKNKDLLDTFFHLHAYFKQIFFPEFLKEKEYVLKKKLPTLNNFYQYLKSDPRLLRERLKKFLYRGKEIEKRIALKKFQKTKR